MAQLSLPLVEKKGGSIGPAINSCMPLNTTDTLWTTDEGSEWLRTGVVIDSTVGYPDATPYVDNYVDNAVTYDVGNVQHSYGFTWDATNGFWWMYDNANKELVQYDEAWVPTGTTILVALKVTTNAYAITNDGTYLYVAEQTPRNIEKYEIATGDWVATFSNANGVGLSGTYYTHGICVAENSLWIRFANYTDDSTYLQQYTLDFQQIGTAVLMDTTDLDYFKFGLAYNPFTKLFYFGTDGVVIRDREGLALGSLPVGSVSPTNTHNVEWKDDLLYTIGTSDDIIITAKPLYYIGSPTAHSDENGVGIFTRIK